MRRFEVWSLSWKCRRRFICNSQNPSINQKWKAYRIGKFLIDLFLLTVLTCISPPQSSQTYFFILVVSVNLLFLFIRGFIWEEKLFILYLRQYYSRNLWTSWQDCHFSVLKSLCWVDQSPVMGWLGLMLETEGYRAHATLLSSQEKYQEIINNWKRLMNAEGELSRWWYESNQRGRSASATLSVWRSNARSNVEGGGGVGEMGPRKDLRTAFFVWLAMRKSIHCSISLQSPEGWTKCQPVAHRVALTLGYKSRRPGPLWSMYQVLSTEEHEQDCYCGESTRSQASVR